MVATSCESSCCLLIAKAALLKDVIRSTYPMSFSYIGGGACAGISDNCPSAGACPDAFTDPTNGTPKQCVGTNAGVRTVILSFGIL
jgi:hypothetical protein